MICTMKFTKGHISLKTVDGVTLLDLCAYSPHSLVMLCNCTKFCESKVFIVTEPRENISKGFRVVEGTQFLY